MKTDFEKMINNDQIFTAFSSEATSQKDRGGSFSGEPFPEVFYTPLAKEKEVKLVRLMSGPSDGKYERGSSRAIDIHVATVHNDNGKLTQLRLPIRKEYARDDHEMWQIIDLIGSYKFNKQTKSKEFKYEKSPLFSVIMRDGVPETDPKYKFQRGWEGQRVFVANVIDRENYQWHKDSKKTRVLVREVTEKRDFNGNLEASYPKFISSYLFRNGLAKLVEEWSNNGCASWFNYDIGIKRYKDQDGMPVLDIFNATETTKVGWNTVPAHMKPLVSMTPLTEEEKSWEQFDLHALYAPTSYSKILKNFGSTIKAIDLMFNTRFFDSMSVKAEAERAMFQQQENEQINQQHDAMAVGGYERNEPQQPMTQGQPTNQWEAPYIGQPTNQGQVTNQGGSPYVGQPVNQDTSRAVVNQMEDTAFNSQPANNADWLDNGKVPF